MEEIKNLENLFQTNIGVKFMYLDVLKQIASIGSCDECRRVVKTAIMDSFENKVDNFVQEKFDDGLLSFRKYYLETRSQPICETGTLIDAGESKKRSEVIEDNYVANKSNRTKEAIGIALKNIGLKIKSSIVFGERRRSVSCISNEEIREELTIILMEHGYVVASRIIGHDRVEFTKW